jgi:hypothetical protein
MAYDKKKIFEQAKEQIKKNNLFFIEDIVAWLPCSKTYFYDAFPLDSDEYNTLKGMLETNKTKTKSAIRSKLFKSNKASELLALYRLIATTEEHQKLNQSYVDHTSKGDKITQQPQFIVQNEEQSEKIKNWLDKLENE